METVLNQGSKSEQAEANLKLCLRLLECQNLTDYDEIEFVEGSLEWIIETAQAGLKHLEEYKWAKRLER